MSDLLPAVYGQVAADSNLVSRAAREYGWIAYQRLMSLPGVEYKIRPDRRRFAEDALAYLEVSHDPDGLVMEVVSPIFRARIGQGYRSTDLAVFAVGYLVACGSGEHDLAWQFVPVRLHG